MPPPSTFIIPACADPEAIERARPLYTESRYHSEPMHLHAVPDHTALESVNEKPERDLTGYIHGVVSLFVKPLVWDFQHGHTSYTSAAEFRIGILDGLRKYAAEMEFDVEVAVKEAEKLLEVLNV